MTQGISFARKVNNASNLHMVILLVANSEEGYKILRFWSKHKYIGWSEKLALESPFIAISFLKIQKIPIG